MRRSASANHSALAATSGACAGSAEIDGMRIETVHVIVEAAPDETDVRAEDEEVAR